MGSAGLEVAAGEMWVEEADTERDMDTGLVSMPLDEPWELGWTVA